MHEACFITASKCKRVFTRETKEAIEKKLKKMSKGSSKILCYPSHHTVVVKIRKWNHNILESEYYFLRRVHVRHISDFPAIPTTNWNWSQKAFQFQSQNHSVLPVWTIFSNVSALMVVQTKFQNTNAPWRYRGMHRKEAFLIPENGGIVSENGFASKPSSQYYFQLQLQMFVCQLFLNSLVVWTKKGVLTVEVPFNSSFMTNVCSRLEMFWSQQILPFTMNNQVCTAIFPGVLPFF